ncbi:GMC oxidoreductase [Variovorax sp. GT1P44]|uniref:GMC oxidoreductase n=1 Tax=Variovorax sp. GT1P44 TaxID=3443742 RepID=UPI003F47BC24
MVARTAIEREAEVVVIGAGAAGCLYADRMSKAGHRVVVLESGPAWALGDLVSSQIWARRLKWSSPLVEQAPGQAAFSQSHATGRGFGGAAIHHFGTWLRLRPEDFRTASLYGKGLDWPIAYDDLRPHYDAIQAEMGIAGDAGAEPWRPPGDPYPMPAHPLFRQAELLGKGFAKVGLATSPLPLAINSREYRGRPGCVYDGWCEAGCPTGALANPLVTHFKSAQQAGATFHAGVTVTRITCDRRGRANGVEYRTEGRTGRIDARLLILTASVIQNPRLLLNSADDRSRKGLANSSGLVGAYLTADAVAPVYGIFDEPTHCFMGMNAGQLLHRGGLAHAKQGAPFGSYQWQIAPSIKPNDLLGIANTRADLFGAKLEEFMRRASTGLASLAGFAGEVPSLENRVAVSSRVASDGMPSAALSYRISDGTRRLWEHLIKEGEGVVRAAGSREVWHGPLAGGHLIGGTVMGKDPARSVCDSYGCCHDVPNLILGGSGLFPGGSGTSPTFTLYAVADRSAAHLLSHVTDWN